MSAGLQNSGSVHSTYITILNNTLLHCVLGNPVLKKTISLELAVLTREVFSDTPLCLITVQLFQMVSLTEIGLLILSADSHVSSKEAIFNHSINQSINRIFYSANIPGKDKLSGVTSDRCSAAKSVMRFCNIHVPLSMLVSNWGTTKSKRSVFNWNSWLDRQWEVVSKRRGKILKSSLHLRWPLSAQWTTSLFSIWA